MSSFEGVVKFRCEHIVAPAPRGAGVYELLVWRDRLQRAGLVGVDENGVGFGNLSIRSERGFIITGTQTGASERLTSTGLTEVTAFDIDANTLTCRGPVAASSESLSHAAVYAVAAEIRAVVHVHDVRRWWRLVGQAPTTDRHVAYGTPAMAHEIQRLIRSGATRVERLIVMAGHVEGLISFGENMDEAGGRMTNEQ